MTLTGLLMEGVSRRNPADLAGACSGGKFVVLKEGEAYDARARGPKRKFRLVLFPIQDLLQQKHCESWPKRDPETLEIRNLTIKRG